MTDLLFNFEDISSFRTWFHVCSFDLRSVVEHVEAAGRLVTEDHRTDEQLLLWMTSCFMDGRPRDGYTDWLTGDVSVNVI